VSHAENTEPFAGDSRDHMKAAAQGWANNHKRMGFWYAGVSLLRSQRRPSDALTRQTLNQGTRIDHRAVRNVDEITVQTECIAARRLKR
jgi:hypothetical protein